MIRPLVESDFDAVISIVNQNWKNVYTGYVNQEFVAAVSRSMPDKQTLDEMIKRHPVVLSSTSWRSV